VRSELLDQPEFEENKANKEHQEGLERKDGEDHEDLLEHRDEMDQLDQLDWMVKEVSQDLMEMLERQDSLDQTDHQERSEPQEPQELQDQPDHEDQPDKTETTDPKDHQDHAETQDQPWSLTFQPDQSHWHQKDPHGDQLTINTNDINIMPRTRRRKRRRMNKNRWICLTSSMDSNSPCSERRNPMVVPSIQQNHAKKFKCASQKLIPVTIGWIPTVDQLMMLLQCTVTSIV